MPYSNQWIASRAAGLEQLDNFSARAGEHYARYRNVDQDAGNHSAVSRLSPWLRHRAVLEQEVIERAVAEHGAKGAQKFIQEVIWRGYWKGWLEHRPALWQRYQKSVETAFSAVADDGTLAANYDRAVEGQTSIAIFNSWVTELLETGYLHNHSRMWFASIWIFTLKLPWQLGADFFIRHLLDGDPASNTLSWRWVAGLHTSGKHYLATRENIEKFASNRVEKYPDGLDQIISDPQRAHPVREQPDWPTEPEPLDLPEDGKNHDGASAILIHEDDCGHKLLGTASLAVALKPQPRSSRPTAANVQSFANDLLLDALKVRAADNEKPDAQDLLQPQDAGGIVRWAKDSGIDVLYTPFAPQGPTARALCSLRKELTAENISLKWSLGLTIC